MYAVIYNTGNFTNNLKTTRHEESGPRNENYIFTAIIRVSIDLNAGFMYSFNVLNKS